MYIYCTIWVIFLKQNGVLKVEENVWDLLVSRVGMYDAHIHSILI